ncbi:MAG: SCO family protein [Pirellulaceae bacterium]
MPTRNPITPTILTLIGLLACPLVALAVPGEDPKELQGLDVQEHLNDPLPLDLTFTNDGGQSVRLGDYFESDKPVILSLNYSNCPMLCRLQLNGLVEALKEIQLTAGQDYQVVSISIDPLEPASRAQETKEKYLRMYDRAGSGDGWNFLVGRKDAIDTVAQATGFQYRYLSDRKEYVHPAVFMLCSPRGRISRYVYGVTFDPATLRLSLVEASEGKVGTTLDRFLLFCFQHDETTGRYGPMARNQMKVGGGITVALLLLGLIPYWLRTRKPKAARQAEESAHDLAGPFTHSTH